MIDYKFDDDWEKGIEVTEATVTQDMHDEAGEPTGEQVDILVITAHVCIDGIEHHAQMRTARDMAALEQFRDMAARQLAWDIHDARARGGSS